MHKRSNASISFNLNGNHCRTEPQQFLEVLRENAA